MWKITGNLSSYVIKPDLVGANTYRQTLKSKSTF